MNKKAKLSYLQSKKEARELRQEIRSMLTQLYGEDFVRTLPKIYHLLGHYVDERYCNEYTRKRLRQLADFLSKKLLKGGIDHE